MEECDNPEDPFEMFSAIGQGITIWTFMEGLIVEIAAALIGTTKEKAGLILYSINFNVWLSLISDLFAQHPRLSSTADRWNVVADKLRGLNDTRVRLAHNTVRLSEPSLTLRPHRYDVRSKSKKHKPMTAQEIVQFSDVLFHIMTQIDRVATELEATIDTNVMGRTAASRYKFAEPELDLGPPQEPPERR